MTEHSCHFQLATALTKEPCSGECRRYFWNGQPSDEVVVVCEAHWGVFSYGYRNAVEVKK